MNKARSTAFVAISILGLILSPAMLSANADSHELMSPRKQMAAGVAAEDVECKPGLVLMIRSTNGAAACVKSVTSMKLSDAGWGAVIETPTEEEMMEETMEEENNDKEIVLEEDFSMGEIKDDSNKTKVELEEVLSTGEQEIEEAPEDVFTIGGIDLSMAAPIEGDEEAPITIIEFGDYQCPQCQKWFLEQKSEITTTYIMTGIAKLYFIDSTWIGDDSISAAQASYCADDQGKYIEYHSALYNNQGGIEDGWANTDGLKQFAADLELDTEMFNECLDSEKYLDRVSHNTQVGATNGVAGTPYFFIVGPEGDIKTISGPQPSIIFDATINSLGY